MTNHIAYLKECNGCHSEIFMAICRDGRWRPFETRQLPPGTCGAWAWRKRQGMEETDRAPGHSIHYCADFHDRAFKFDGNFVPPLAEEAS